MLLLLLLLLLQRDLGQRRSLRSSLAHTRPHMHWQSLVLHAQREALEKLFQQHLRRNREYFGRRTKWGGSARRSCAKAWRQAFSAASS